MFPHLIREDDIRESIVERPTGIDGMPTIHSLHSAKGTCHARSPMTLPEVSMGNVLFAPDQPARRNWMGVQKSFRPWVRTLAILGHSGI